MYTMVIIYLQRRLQTEILCGTLPGIQILAVPVDSRQINQQKGGKIAAKERTSCILVKFIFVEHL